MNWSNNRAISQQLTVSTNATDSQKNIIYTFLYIQYFMVSTDQIMINVFLNILNQPVKLETAKVQLQVRSNRQELLQEGKIEVSIDV